MIIAMIAAFCIAYLLGNLNGAIVISRLIANEDVRTKGSGNAGLTNFTRNYGSAGSVFVILIDVGKAALACLIGGLVAGRIVCGNWRRTLSPFLQGAAAMLPAVALIAIASSVKLVIDESHILDTIMHGALQILEGKGRFVTILLIYALILFLQLFIGSPSAKIFLVMPIILPITRALGISPQLVILTYCPEVISCRNQAWR